MANSTKYNERANNIFQLEGAVFFRTSEKLNSSATYPATDNNGAGLNIAGKPVYLEWKGRKTNYLPAQTQYKDKYQYVGLAGAANANLGNFSIKVGNTEETYRVKETPGIETYTIQVNGTAYEMSISFRLESNTWMLYPKPTTWNGAKDTTEAKAYFVGIDSIKTSSNDNKQKEAQENAQKEARILSEIKDQQTIAGNKLKEAQAAQTIAENTQNLEEAQKAANTGEEAYNAAQKAANTATIKASEIPRNQEAQEAAQKTQDYANTAKGCAKKAKKCTERIKEAKDRGVETANKKEAQTLSEIKDQQTIAANKLKEAQEAQVIAESTQNLEEALKAAKTAEEAHKAAQEAADTATAKATEIPYNQEAQQAAANTTDSAKKAQDHAISIKAIISKLHQAQNDAQEAEEKAKQVNTQQEAQKDAQQDEESSMLSEVKDQQTIAADKLKEAQAAQVIAENTQDLEDALKAKNIIEEAYHAGRKAANLATNKAAKISDNQEAQKAAADAIASVQKTVKCNFKIKAIIAKLQKAQNAS